MIRISDKRRCMASLATFRNMYGKADIFDIVAELSRQTIVENGVTTMKIDEFHSLFKKETGIDVPLSMVESSLKRLPFIDLDRKNFTINEKLTKEECDSVKETIAEQESKNELLFNSLKAYVEAKESRKVSDEEEHSLINTFCSHIVDEAYTGPFIEYVCSFILENEPNASFMKYLNMLREGTIIFVGYTYTAQDGYFDSIDSVINIYLETEILFHMAGYNGPLYKKLFDEFYQQVEEINKRAKKTLINLYCFEETEIEVDNYFKTACRIVEREESPKLEKDAMISITNGCTEAYQVRQKQDEFNRLKKEHHIKLDRQNSYNDSGNYQFTIEHKKFLDIEDTSEEKILEKLKFLNNINVKRGGRPQKIFRNIGHVLLSGNSLTFRIASDDAIRPKNSLAFVFSLGTLTNRFWLSLNKGLIPDMKLNNFNMIAKSRVALANKVKVTISKIYKEIEDDLKSEKISIEQAKESLAGLRRDNLSADQIDKDEIDRCISIIKNGELELYISIKENERKRDEEQKAESEKKVKEARAKLAETENQVSKLQDKNDAMVKAMMGDRNKNLRKKFEEEIASYEDRKSQSVDWDYEEYQKGQVKLLFVYFVVYAILYALVSWAAGSKTTGFAGVIIIGIIQFFWNAIPFLRSIFPFDNLKKAMLFVMSQDERDNVRNDLEDKYEHTYPRPVLLQVNEDDIRKEIEKIMSQQ